MVRGGGLSFTKEDLDRIDDAIRLLDQLYGFAPQSRAELVRLAVRDFLAAKRKEFEERHPLGTKAKKVTPPGR
jgi:metal-responsive CopG/Arc/MetJ family transcriptional regulator